MQKTELKRLWLDEDWPRPAIANHFGISEEELVEELQRHDLPVFRKLKYYNYLPEGI